jgi:hypothetical protein
MLMKKTALTVILMILTALQGTLAIYWVSANPSPYASNGSQNVHVAIESPTNKTYNTNDILVTIAAGGFPGVAYVRYSVDDGPSIDLDPINWWGHSFSASVWIKRLSQGSHKIVATSKVFETAEVCSTVYFTLTKALEPTPSPSPTAPNVPQKVPLTIKVQGTTIGLGVCDLEFSVYVPYEIRTLYDCVVKADYRTLNDEWKTASKNIGTVNYGDYRNRRLPLGRDVITWGVDLVNPDELTALIGSVKIEGYGFLEPKETPYPEPSATPEATPQSATFTGSLAFVAPAGIAFIVLTLVVHFKRFQRVQRN